MRIHIIGGSGTGKTYLSGKLADKYGIPSFDLDDLFWDNSANQYGVKMPIEKRDKMLYDILQKDDWIIEGVYFAWLAESFKKADTIIILDIPGRIYRYRILRRFLQRKFKIASGKKETFKTLIALLKWTKTYQKENLPRIYALLNEYADKTISLHSRQEIQDFISS